MMAKERPLLLLSDTSVSSVENFEPFFLGGCQEADAKPFSEQRERATARSIELNVEKF